MENFKEQNPIGSELMQKVQEIELPDFSDFHPELFRLIGEFQNYKETVDGTKLIEQHPKILKELKELGDINVLRTHFLFHLMVGSTPNINDLISFDTPQKDLTKLMQKIINNNI